MILFPFQTFSCRLQYQSQTIKQVNIGIQGKEATEHFPKQTNIPGTGKAVAVEGDFNVHPRSK